jgi:DNA-binding response OmpR family regulator
MKNVLLVDDDRDLLAALKESLGKHADSFSILLAADGQEALDYLDRRHVSLVVTDLSLPRLDGFELLATIRQKYPELPVIIITDLQTPGLERMVQQAGATAFVAKPLPVDHLAWKIGLILRRESEGGTLHDVSSGMFLQLIEMEQKTCTIRVEDRTSGKRGVLFIVEGRLLDARVGSIRGEAAACEIFGWDPVSLSIQCDCAVSEDRINKDLHLIVLDAARCRDERKFRPDSEFAKVQTESEVFQRIRSRIESALGEHCGLEAVFRDSVWTQQLGWMSRHGEKLQLGKLVMGYMDHGDSAHYIVLADEPPIIMAVSPRCPRDRIMQLLSGC